ncbi:peptide ligase PGM1-related protein [Actinomadura terrae]|uniref:preATP grasp domain-containing protein n=1 Tax=Actinomadura terrae TaxID=604353 RepID=UPI0027E016D3|nr:peptide ligase PGM1-related protein [Actinomadura terrae]
MTPADWQAIRGHRGLLLWLARPRGVFVLSSRPDDLFVRYVTALLGFSPDDITILVPPPGRLGFDMLTFDRLRDEDFMARLSKAADKCTSFTAYHQDRRTCALAERLGLGASVPGRAFIEQGGADYLNSKSFFRVFATGHGLPIPAGDVVRAFSDAEEAVSRRISRGSSVIVKRDFHTGGYGNFVISAEPGLRAIGAQELLTVASPHEVADVLASKWSFLTSDGGHPVVIEEYHRNSTTYAAEIGITDDGVRMDALVEMRMEPRVSGFEWFRTDDHGAPVAVFHRKTLRLADLVRSLGYRGMMSIDGIRTPDGRTLFTEFNGRLSGLTHLQGMLTTLVAPDYLRERAIAAGYFQARSFKDAHDRLATAGVSFDPEARKGVVLTGQGPGGAGAFPYCAIGTSRTALADLESAITDASL